MSNKKQHPCPYCGEHPVLVSGARIYPRRPDLHEKPFWMCVPCNAYCGCHPGSTMPLGLVANTETRDARRKAHNAFDQMWKRGKMSRRAAYHWLAKQTGIPVRQCHIGMMNIEQCQLVMEVVNNRRMK